MRILVSGFDSFGGERVNPSQELALAVQGDAVFLSGFSAEVQGVILPTSFKDSFPELLKAIEDFEPQVVLAFGQATGRATIDLERVAINVMDGEIADNDGLVARDLPIMPGGEAAYFSTLPMRAIQTALQSVGIESRISNSAGTFVCNSVFYQLQQSLVGTDVRSGFVHVPMLPSQAVGKNEKLPSMPLEKMKQALRVILDTVTKSGPDTK